MPYRQEEEEAIKLQELASFSLSWLFFTVSLLLLLLFLFIQNNIEPITNHTDTHTPGSLLFLFRILSISLIFGRSGRQRERMEDVVRCIGTMNGEVKWDKITTRKGEKIKQRNPSIGRIKNEHFSFYVSSRPTQSHRLRHSDRIIKKKEKEKQWGAF